MDLKRETEKDKKLYGLFLRIETLIEQFEQYLVHGAEDESYELKKKVDASLETMRNILMRESKFYNEKLIPFLKKKGYKKEISHIKSLHSDKMKMVNKLIDEVNVLVKKPESHIIEKIHELVEAIEWALSEEVKIDESLLGDNHR